MIPAFYDTECFPNYWLLKMQPENGPVFAFELNSGETLSERARANIEYLFTTFQTISFNGNGYDVWMIAAALNGFSCEQLKWLSDQIIVEGAKPWTLGLPRWEPADHIDVMEVAPGAGSQKQYAGRIHSKTMRDLPYDPNRILTTEEKREVSEYCGNDLSVLSDLFHALHFELEQRIKLSERYGIDLRSKSDAQLAEAVLRRRCEQATGRRIARPEINYNLAFKYQAPAFISFKTELLQNIFAKVTNSIFRLSESGNVALPKELDGLTIPINKSVYRMGIGGLHSSEKNITWESDENHVIRDNDVASYYPSLILNSGRWPAALGQAFLAEYAVITSERLAAKKLQGELKKSGDTSSDAYNIARCENERGKIMINGTFGKTGSAYSVLFAPEMLIQTTITGQLAILMLIEIHEMAGIPVISANTDGIVTYCEKWQVPISDEIIKQWEEITGLEMEIAEYKGIYSRDVNNYIAVKSNGDVKRKGAYGNGGLAAKVNPSCDICGDAVAAYLSKGTPILETIALCTDIRKFVTIRKVNGGALKMWGEGPKRDAKVKDMVNDLLRAGWVKDGRKWTRDGRTLAAKDAYETCFDAQRPEFLGHVVRWYYGVNTPGPIVYKSNGNLVSDSYGAAPCMTLPDSLPGNIDYKWYIDKAESMLAEFNIRK